MDRISEDINKQEMEKVYEGKLEYSTQVHKAHKKVNEGTLSEEYSTVLGSTNIRDLKVAKTYDAILNSESLGRQIPYRQGG